MNAVQNKMFNDIIAIPNNAAKNKKGLFIGPDFYDSLFAAGIDSGISYTWLSLCLKKSQGAPVKIKNQIVVTVQWIQDNPEYLM